MDLSNLDIRRIINLERCERLLTDMNRMMGLNFRLFDVNGSVVKQVPSDRVPCRNPAEEGSIPKECEQDLQQLFDQVRAKGTPAHSTCRQGYSLMGVNIGTPPALFGVITVCQAAASASSKELSLQTEGDAVEGPGGDLTNFLVNFTDLLANECYQNVELDNISEELDTRYEELHLIYEIGKEIRVTANL